MSSTGPTILLRVINVEGSFLWRSQHCELSPPWIPTAVLWYNFWIESICPWWYRTAFRQRVSDLCCSGNTMNSIYGAVYCGRDDSDCFSSGGKQDFSEHAKRTSVDGALSHFQSAFTKIRAWAQRYVVPWKLMRWQKSYSFSRAETRLVLQLWKKKTWCRCNSCTVTCYCLCDTDRNFFFAVNLSFFVIHIYIYRVDIFF